jgi:MFS family permease
VSDLESEETRKSSAISAGPEVADAQGPSAPTETPATETPAPTGASHIWRALRHRNFRLFFGGQTISLIGTWMTRIATSWLVYRLTGSALLLGTVSFAGQIPTFLVAPFAGVWVDRLNRRQVLVWTQTLSMIQSLLLAALTFSGHITIGLILFLSVMQGVVNAFDMPARQAFMMEMVGDRADLGNAIAINSSMVNVARLIGPSLAGMLIAVTSEGWCFLVDGISYIAVIASLLMMQLNAAAVLRKATSMVTELKEGWSYVAGFLPIRTILLLFAVISLMGMPFVVLMPIFAVKVLNGGPHTLGFLMGAMGVGALASALSLAARRSVRGLIRMIPVAAAVFGVGLIGFGLSHVFWLSMVMALVAGMGMMQGMAASNTVIQTLVTEDKRGRVMSYYTMAFMGMAPFGSLLAGTLAHAIPPMPIWFVGGTPLSGAQWTVILNGVVVVLGAAWFTTQLPALRRVVRPIYQEMGIIPAATEMAAEQIRS